MTQEEIVTLLKENKKKGVAYLFMPLDVKDWISDNFNNSNLVYLDSMGDWELYKNTNFDDYDNIVFALLDEGKDVRPAVPIKIRFWRDARADVEFY